MVGVVERPSQGVGEKRCESKAGAEMGVGSVTLDAGFVPAVRGVLRSVKEVDGVYGVRVYGDPPFLDTFEISLGTLPDRV